MALLVAILLVTCSLNALTQGSLFEEMSTDRLSPSQSFDSGKMSFSSRGSSLHTLSRLAGLGAHSGFRYATGQMFQSAKGVKRLRLIQTYGGYDVFGSSVEAELDSKETFSGQMYGDVVKDLHKHIPDPKACKRNINVFHHKAMRIRKLRPRDSTIEKKGGRRIIYVSPDIDQARLAYEIKFFYKDGNRYFYPVFIFDACNGAVLLSHDQLRTMLPQDQSVLPKHQPNTYAKRNYKKRSVNQKHSPVKKLTKTARSASASDECSVDAAGKGGNPNIGKITYNEDPHCLNVQKLSIFCRMVGRFVRVIDNKQTDRRRKFRRVKFICKDGYSDEINEGYGIANDAFFNGETFGKMFQNKYRMEILPFKPRLVVHFDQLFENALCDGKDMFFGDGQNNFYPMVTLDIVAHEMAHAVINENSRLLNSGMPGGIAESFCDIASKVTQIYDDSSKIDDWTIGSEIHKHDGAIRFMSDPTKDGNSIKSIVNYRPFMNVHYSSGLFNYVFYTLVKEDDMDVYAAFKCFLDANLNLWKPLTNFLTGACGVMQAAYDNGYDHDIVRQAFRRVGIPLFFCRYAALTTTMFLGETREGVLVGGKRAPILKVQLDQVASNFTYIEARIHDEHSENVQLVVGTDDETKRIITTGNNVVKVSTSHEAVYVKLVSNAAVDKEVDVKVYV